MDGTLTGCGLRCEAQGWKTGREGVEENKPWAAGDAPEHCEPALAQSIVRRLKTIHAGHFDDH